MCRLPLLGVAGSSRVGMAVDAVRSCTEPVRSFLFLSTTCFFVAMARRITSFQLISHSFPPGLPSQGLNYNTIILLL